MALGFRVSGIGASSRNSPPLPPEPRTSETDEEMQAMSDVAMKSRSPQTPIPGCFETQHRKNPKATTLADLCASGQEVSQDVIEVVEEKI